MCLLYFIRNSEGYHLAIEYAKKIDFVSPVWYHIVPTTIDSQSSFEVLGDEHKNENFLKDLAAANKNIKIVPRLSFEFPKILDDFKNFLKFDHLMEGVDMIQQFFYGKNNYDGIVFDIPYISSVGLQPWIQFFETLKMFGQRYKNPKLIMAIISSPIDTNSILEKDEINWMLNNLDRVLLKLYDYPNQSKESKLLSPINWYTRSIQKILDGIDALEKKSIKKKLLIGLPFYGYEINYANGIKKSISKNEFLKYLSEENPPIIRWNQIDQECVIRGFQSKNIFYPCPQFLDARMAVIKEAGLGGLYIWEGGEGLPYFYELLQN